MFLEGDGAAKWVSCVELGFLRVEEVWLPEAQVFRDCLVDRGLRGMRHLLSGECHLLETVVDWLGL